MVFSCLQENLKNGLNVVSHAAGRNVNLPILNNVLIEAKNGDIKLITTNLEIGVISRIRGKIDQEGSYTVNSKIMADYVNNLNNSKVNIVLREQELVIECDNYKTKIRGQGAEEFPLIPQVENTEKFDIPIDDFKKGVAKVSFAVSTSDSRLELTGVMMSFREDILVMAATDSYRLSEKKIKVKNEAKKEMTVIVPAKTIQELSRILSSGKDEVVEDINCLISENQILFKFGNTELVSRLIEGQYPDYKQIIPQNSKTKALVERQELIRAVKAASLFSKTGINDVNLDFPEGKNQMVVSSASGQTGENVTELTAQVNGADNGVVVNYRYLLDGLNSFDTEQVWLEVVDSNTPCLIHSDKEDGQFYIVMPIKQ